MPPALLRSGEIHHALVIAAFYLLSIDGAAEDAVAETRTSAGSSPRAELLARAVSFDVTGTLLRLPRLASSTPRHSTARLRVDAAALAHWVPSVWQSSRSAPSSARTLYRPP